MPVANIRPSTDAWTNQEIPAENNPRTPRLRVRASTTGRGRRAYLYFSPPFVPGSGQRVTTGKLHLRAANAWSGTQYLVARRIVEPWEEASITWANAPAVSNDNLAIAQVTNARDGDLIELDITQILADVAAGAAWYGVRLETTVDAPRHIWSADADRDALRPRVVIEHRPLVEPPTLLAPIGGQAVAVASPTLTWRVDGDAEFEQAASRVQIATDETFGSPVYDSGKVANVEGQWSLEGRYQLTENVTYYWRAKVWDLADQESDWSDTHEMTYATKGTLTIVNPPENGVVLDNTPVYVWELQGATQTAYRVEVHRLPRDFWGPLSLHFDTGWRQGDDTQVRQPNYWPLQEGQRYEVIVQVRDEFDRAATPEDPGVYEARREFEFQHANITSPSTLKATPKGPRVELEWTVAETPDEFAIKRDGEFVLDGIDPDEVRVSGNTYRTDVWLARGGKAHTWEVCNVVYTTGPNWSARQISGNNPTAQAVTNPKGVWLVDPDDATAVQFVAPEDGGTMDIQLHEVAETYDPISSPRPVRISSALGGYRGTYSGGVLGWEARDAFLRLRARRKRLRLLYGDLNIPVRLEEPSTQPSNVPGHKYWHASFGFFQVGEFEEVLDP